VTTGRSATGVPRKQTPRSSTNHKAGADGGVIPHKVDHPQPEPASSGELPGAGSTSPNLGNDPLEDTSPARVLSNRELRELRKKEKKVKEKFEVRCDPPPVPTARHSNSTAEGREAKGART